MNQPRRTLRASAARLAACVAAVFAFASATTAQPGQPPRTGGDGQVAVSGELKQWHKVTLDLAGPFAQESDTKPNPFTDYRFEVTFAHESGSSIHRVPGYFAADGNAGETGADSGSVWRAHLAPDKPGRWSYRVSFTRGPGVATSGGGAALAPYDGRSGSFDIAATDKSGRDFRAKGRLQYVGAHHLRFAGTGEYFLKAGADSPETFLGCSDFDGTVAGNTAVPLKSWAPHVRDWRNGDPTWRGGRGKGIVGAINYLASKGLNSVSFLTYNAGGDGDNVWPFVTRNDKLHFDCSKLDQWELVFAHAQRQGVYLHFKLQETENDDRRKRSGDAIVEMEPPADGSPAMPEALDGGAVGPERKLYLRELIARFGHHLALNWNLGEENTQTPDEQRAMAQFIADTDPYGHHRVIHTYPNMQEKVYEPLVGRGSMLTGASLQNMWNETHARTVQWVEASAKNGRRWVVANDEQGSSRTGVPPDPGYKGFDGTATEEGHESHDLHGIRRCTLWGNLMAGGAGVEYYFGYRLAENDLVAEDFRSRDRSWEYCRIALEFFARERIPFWKMLCADELVGNPAHDNSRYCFADPGELYLVYLPRGGDTTLDLNAAAGTFDLHWFNPRDGAIRTALPTIEGGTTATLRAPDQEDWVAVVRLQRADAAKGVRSLTVGPTPESVVRGFDGRLFVTLMGTERKRGDGDGKIVVVDGDRVSDFAGGLDDPKGIVFVGGRLITADYDKVWAFDSRGERTLLAGPEAFPEPPRMLNDVAVEPDGIVHDRAGNLYLTEVRTGHVWRIVAATGQKRLLATLQSAADLILDEERSELIIADSKAGKLVFLPLDAPDKLLASSERGLPSHTFPRINSFP